MANWQKKANKGVHNKVLGLAGGIKIVSQLTLAGVVIWIFVSVFSLVEALTTGNELMESISMLKKSLYGLAVLTLLMAGQVYSTAE